MPLYEGKFLTSSGTWTCDLLYSSQVLYLWAIEGLIQLDVRTSLSYWRLCYRVHFRGVCWEQHITRVEDRLPQCIWYVYILNNDWRVKRPLMWHITNKLKLLKSHHATVWRKIFNLERDLNLRPLVLPQHWGSLSSTRVMCCSEQTPRKCTL